MNPITHLRLAGLIEGLSYLFLLFVAMPVKYFMGVPEAVKYTGWVHGILFIWFCIALLQAAIMLKWSFVRTVLSFISSLIPFGTFVLDRNLKNEKYQKSA